MQLFAAPTREEIARTWPHIEKFVRDVCARSRGEITPDAFRRALDNGDAQLWVIADASRERSERVRAVLGTRLAHTMSGMKVCNIILCAGRGRKEWVHLIYKLADWARSEGCEKFSILARRGWERDLTMFRKTSMEMEMWLTEGSLVGQTLQNAPEPLRHKHVRHLPESGMNPDG